MKVRITCWLAGLLISSSYLPAQSGENMLLGKVVQTDESGAGVPVAGASVYWMGTTTGALSNKDGAFRLPKVEATSRVVVSYIGSQRDTLETEGKDSLIVYLRTEVDLDEVEIVARNKSTSISFLSPMKTEVIGEKELLKAACCNLSESFETSASVDVSFTDAVTGTRQIQMLGLAGPYTQITRENMPDIRGLSSMYGMIFTPGTWIESIQLNKGTGSVVNGFESVAGQINVELRKPESADKWYLNLYANQMGRLEGNVNYTHKFNDTWSTALLLHGKDNSIRNDQNGDGFLDNPVGNNFIAVNRWKYIGDNGLMFQAGVKGTYIRNTGGEMDFDRERDLGGSSVWGMALDINRLEGWTKIGKVFPDKPWKSVGLQISGLTHEQNSFFGQRKYDAVQRSGYANLIYQGIFGNTNHKFRTGLSFMYDDYEEAFEGVNYDRTEVVPGGYFEYTYSWLERFSVVAGLRADHHNTYGAFVTPRLHLRYALTENTVLRASAGRGQRTANILAENNGLLASSREIIIGSENNSNKPYGLEAEVAWNYGINLTRNFRLDYRDGLVSVDLYRTDFQNQIVIDRDNDPQRLLFYNLDGKSYSNSFQILTEYEVLRRLDVRVAYRWFDVKTTYSGELLQKPLVSQHRAFTNFAYETRKYWKFDLTVNWQGARRIPFTGTNPEEFQLDTFSPDFFLINGQISKTWWEKFEVYLGVENLLNYRQQNPILSSEMPFSEYFDSSLVWGPIFGRNIYLGLRYKVK